MSEKRYVPKAWGHEEILVATPLYTLKRLTVLPGFRCSLHYHAEKDETFLVESGRLQLETVAVTSAGDFRGERSHRIYSAGQQVTLPPYTAHRFQCATDEPCVFLEVSTADRETDSYRLELSGATG